MKKIALVMFLMFVLAAPAMGKTVINLPPGYGQDQFKDLSTDLGLAISYMPLAPAEPLGTKLLPGFDIGVEATYVKIDNNKAYWKDIAQAGGDDIPAALAIPKVHIQVGLPVVPIDLGYMYASVPGTDIKLSGGEVKWAVVRGSTLIPAIAVRGAYTKLTGVDVLDISTKSLDVSISKGFAILTPYAGIGEVWITSEENDPNVTLKKEDITEMKTFVGLKVTFFPLMNLVAEADFAAVNSYSLRLNIHF